MKPTISNPRDTEAAGEGVSALVRMIGLFFGALRILLVLMFLYLVFGGMFYVEQDKVAMISNVLRDRTRVPFEELLLRCRTRSEMVVTFIALLEIIKLGEALVVQEGNFGDIFILAANDNEGVTDRASHEPAPGA